MKRILLPLAIAISAIAVTGCETSGEQDEAIQKAKILVENQAIQAIDELEAAGKIAIATGLQINEVIENDKLAQKIVKKVEKAKDYVLFIGEETDLSMSEVMAKEGVGKSQ